jgi:hypothetical protein
MGGLMKISKLTILLFLFYGLIFLEGIGIIILGQVGILENGWLGAIVAGAGVIGALVLIIGLLTSDKHIEKDERVERIAGSSARIAFFSLIVILLQIYIFEFVTGTTVSFSSVGFLIFGVAGLIYAVAYLVQYYG